MPDCQQGERNVRVGRKAQRRRGELVFRASTLSTRPEFSLILRLSIGLSTSQRSCLPVSSDPWTVAVGTASSPFGQLVADESKWHGAVF